MNASDHSLDDVSSEGHLSYAVARRVLNVLTTQRLLAELAEDVGATDRRLLWHLRHLRDVGLVQSTDDELGWSRTKRGAWALDVFLPLIPSQAFLQRIVDDFEDAFIESRAGLFGDEYVQASGEHRTRLSPAQAAEFRDRLVGLVEEYFAPGQGDRSGVKYGFHWVLTPIDVHPLDESDLPTIRT